MQFLVDKVCHFIFRQALRKGIKELNDLEKFEQIERIRNVGDGRKRIDIKNPKIIDEFEAILDENTAGDPMSFLKWTIKSTYNVAEELTHRGYKISAETVRLLLKERKYSLQANVKSKEGGSGPERDSQFRYINEHVKDFIQQGDPVISVDTKKSENVGDFKNSGRTWRKKGLKVFARLDQNEYEGGMKFSDEEMAKLNLKTHELHPKWNYLL